MLRYLNNNSLRKKSYLNNNIFKIRFFSNKDEGKLVLEDGTVFKGKMFGSRCSSNGEVIFSN